MKSGPRRVFRYSSRYEKTLPNGPFRCRMELHRTSHAASFRTWPTADPQPPRDTRRELLYLEKRLPVASTPARLFRSLKAKVHSAKVMYWDGIKTLLQRADEYFPRLKHLWVDAGYRGEDKGKDWALRRPSDGVWISSSARASLPQRKFLWRGLSNGCTRAWWSIGRS
jgi:hypothetical protein